MLGLIMNTWLVVLNSETCKIYDYHKGQKKLIPIKELHHYQSTLKGRDLITDRPGHYQTYSTARGSYTSNESPQEIEFEKFAIEIANTLDVARKSNQCEQLLIIAPPHMTGLINHHMPPQLKKNIKSSIVKDYVNLNDHDLLEMLEKTNVI